MRLVKQVQLLTTMVSLGFAAVAPNAAFATDETTGGKMSTAKTQDIINSLRERGAFHKMLDGLEDAFAMDNKLKGKGPFTVFACDDKGWAHLNQADQDTLFGNKNKLKQVFLYEIVDGKLDSNALKSMSSVKSLEGHEIHLSMHDDKDKKKAGLYADKARIKTADIVCSNGIIHITDEPIMPKLAE